MKTLLLPAALALSIVSTFASPSPERPNVLFIAIDDLNDWIGTLGGHPQALTPQMDKLFERGTYFTNAHCAAPVCNTSRHSLISGLHPTTTGWYGTAGMKNIEASYQEVLGERVPLPTHFKNNGYKTLAAGKILHKGVQDFDYPYWDETRRARYNFRPDSFKTHHFAPFPKDGGQIVAKHGGKVKGDTLCWAALEDYEIPEHGMPDEQIADWAVSQLQKKHDKPFFLAVGFLRPHVPFTAPKKYFEPYPLESITMPEVPANDLNDVPLYGKAMIYGTLPEGDHKEVLDTSPNYWKELVRGYLACTTFVDDQVGKVIHALENSPYADNTIIVLWSDHGQHLGEKKHWRKQALWEESTRVPLFFSYPGMPQTGQINDSPVSLLDIYPTLSALANLPEQSLDGINLKPLIDDPEAERGRPVLTTRYTRNHAIRSQDWRYIRYRDGTEELYDHRSDPNEFHNLASNPEYQSVLEQHRAALPKHEAYPVGKDNFPSDSYDKRVASFKKNGLPPWLE